MEESDTIPVIDFGPFVDGTMTDRKRVAEKIRRASQAWGFFYLANHGLPEELIQRSFQASRDFFALPSETKMASAWQTASSNRGYVAVRRERLDPSKPGDLKEAFNAGPELGADTVAEGAQPYQQNLWPPGQQEFREQVLALVDACVSTSNEVLAAFAVALDLPDDFFQDAHDQCDHTLRLLHYPPLPEDFQPADGESRAGMHTDYGSITLLVQDAVGGLEVCTRSGRWVQAPPIEGTVVVNTGDLMQRWTNHVFCSTPHRVGLPAHARQHHRYSMAFFCHPNPDVNIRCIPTCTDADNPPRYAPITAGEYLLERLNATY